MFILRFINDDDDLSVKEFVSLADLKEYINKKAPILKRTRAFQISLSKRAVRTGLEPVTPCVTGMYSNQLN